MTTTAQPVPASRNPSDLVRPLHSLLTTQLGLPSPLAKAVEALDRASKLAFGSQVGTSSARQSRALIARAIATGAREFDEAALREFDEQRIWVSDGNAQATPAATQLAEQVRTQAQQVAGAELNAHAPGIFDMLAAEARAVVAVFEGLPDPPPQLFTGGGDGAQLLTRAPGHEATYGTVLRANDRFWGITRAADAVRQAAGHGVERFPDGAPRLAATYRNWKLAMGKEPALRLTGRHFRLWRCVLDGWEPGVWTETDIKVDREDQTFSAKLARFGGAVGVPSGLPPAELGA